MEVHMTDMPPIVAAKKTKEFRSTPQEQVIMALEWTCDMIKGNESLIENFNSYFLAPLSLLTFNMLSFDPNPITIDIWLQSCEEFVNDKNNINKGI